MLAKAAEQGYEFKIGMRARGLCRVRRADRRRRDRVSCRAIRTSLAMPDLDSFTSCRGSRTWRASPVTSPSRARRGRTARARSCATCSRRPRSRATSSRSGSSSSTSSCSSTPTARSRSPTSSTRSRSPVTTWPGLTRQYDFLTTVSRYCNELGWGNYANDHEDANGQFEQNFEYADALTSCDRAIFFRYMVHTLAEQYGRDRDLHAEAVHDPDRQRLPLPHVALEGRRQRLPRRVRRRAGSASRRRRTTSSAASRRTPAPTAR